MPNSSARRFPECLILAGLLLCVATVYYSGIRAGHDWGGDFSMYLMNARNLVQGRPYAETGYLYETNVTVGPSAYPPGFPALLAGPIAIHGLDIEALKRYMVAFPVLFLGLFYLLARFRSGPGAALAASLLVAASPMLWDLKERLLSDVPFLMWLYLMFVIAGVAERSTAAQRRPWLGGIGLGCVASLCIATRTVGFLLVPALVLLDLWQARKIRTRTWIALGIIASSWGIQAATLGLESDYLRLAQALTESNSGTAGQVTRPWTVLGVDVGALPSRLLAIPGNLSIFWTWANPGDTFTMVPTAMVGVCALGGLATTWRRGAGLHDMFAPLYLAALLVLPAGLGTEGRLFLPIQTLLYLYAAIGLEALYKASGRRCWALTPALALTALLGMSYARSYEILQHHSFAYGPLSPEATRTFEFIRASTPRSAKFLFSKPRVLVLFTDRRSGAIPNRVGPDSLAPYLAEAGADYLLVHRLLDRELSTQLHRARFHLHPVYRSANFALYEIR